MENKLLVRICAWCQKLNHSEFKEYTLGVPLRVLAELNQVDQQVVNNRDNFNITHTICKRHAYQMYKKQGFPEDEIIKSLAKVDDSTECLITNNVLRKAYMKGLFTPELQQQANQSQNIENEVVTGRFKKLAGIKS